MARQWSPDAGGFRPLADARAGAQQPPLDRGRVSRGGRLSLTVYPDRSTRCRGSPQPMGAESKVEPPSAAPHQAAQARSASSRSTQAGPHQLSDPMLDHPAECPPPPWRNAHTSVGQVGARRSLAIQLRPTARARAGTCPRRTPCGQARPYEGPAIDGRIDLGAAGHRLPAVTRPPHRGWSASQAPARGQTDSESPQARRLGAATGPDPTGRPRQLARRPTPGLVVDRTLFTLSRRGYLRGPASSRKSSS